MTLSVEVNGTIYREALSIRYRRSLLDFCGSYEVMSSANEQELLPVKTGDVVKILADDSQVLLGFIEKVNVSTSSDDHTITFSGRDRTCDALDSSVTNPKSYDTDIGYIAVIRDILNAGNMGSIGIDNEVGTIPAFSETDNVNPEVAQTIFDFAEKYAAKLGFLLTSNEEGNVLLCRASTQNLGFNLLHEKNNNENNILSSLYTKDDQRRFNKYTAISQLGTYGLGAEVTPADIVSQSGDNGVDSDIRNTRMLTFNTEQISDNESCQERSRFEANLRRAKSLEYSCAIQGHSYQGEPFKINRLATVKDDFANISAQLLLHTVDMSWSLNSGSISTLSFSFRDAFTL